MKKILKIVVNTLSWIILAFAFLITLLVFSSDRNNGVPNFLGYMPFTVETNSMKPTFEENDLIISKQIDDPDELKEGDVITFWTLIDSKRVKNTHRIVEIRDNSGTLNYITRGDANSQDDELSVHINDVIGKWTEVRIKGFGKVMSFLRTKTGFFICILIPMIIFFLFELYKLIIVIIEIKREDTVELDEEEIKRRAIEEYIAEQKKLNGENSDSSEKEATDVTDPDKTENT